jgi:hypothetical protein
MFDDDNDENRCSELCSKHTLPPKAQYLAVRRETLVSLFFLNTSPDLTGATRRFRCAAEARREGAVARGFA